MKSKCKNDKCDQFFFSWFCCFYDILYVSEVADGDLDEGEVQTRYMLLSEVKKITVINFFDIQLHIDYQEILLTMRSESQKNYFSQQINLTRRLW